MADHLEARLFEAGQRADERHVGVQYAGSARDQPMYRRVDAKRRALDVAAAAQQAAVVIDLQQAARGDLAPVQPERDLEMSIVGAGYGKGEMVEDAFAETLPVREPMCRREIDAPCHAAMFDMASSRWVDTRLIVPPGPESARN